MWERSKRGEEETWKKKKTKKKRFPRPRRPVAGDGDVHGAAMLYAMVNTFPVPKLDDGVLRNPISCVLL